jgi:hypothetical protein
VDPLRTADGDGGELVAVGGLNPARTKSQGKSTHRLIPDPVRAPIVLEVFEDYCLRDMGLARSATS